MEVSATGALGFGVGWSRNAAVKTAATHTTARSILACFVYKNCLIFSFIRYFFEFLECVLLGLFDLLLPVDLFQVICAAYQTAKVCHCVCAAIITNPGLFG